MRSVPVKLPCGASACTGSLSRGAQSNLEVYMAKLKVTHFTVKGVGAFPIDMLRYDQAWPEREGYDSVAISRSLDLTNRHPEFVEVRLVTHSKVTPGRWLSFGWQVIKQETMTL
jgi:hypothetical protein